MKQCYKCNLQQSPEPGEIFTSCEECGRNIKERTGGCTRWNGIHTQHYEFQSRTNCGDTLKLFDLEHITRIF